jgi:hypothetical protein
MAPAHLSTIVRERAGHLPMGASAPCAPSRHSSINDHQQGAQSDRAPLPHGHIQFAGADAPRQRPVSRLLLPRGIGHHLPGRAFVAAPGLFIHHMQAGSRRPHVHSTPRKHVSRRLAYVGKHLRRLSCSPSFDGSKTIEKAFRDGRISFGGQQIVFPG